MNTISNYSHYIYTPNFTSLSRDVYNKGKLIYRNDTTIFRSDIKDWDNFAQYIGDKFKNCDKANIYSFSCSSGDEVYSLAMKLLEKYGEKGSEKFFPIIASDYDRKIIKMAKQGYLPMFENDINVINEQTNGKFNKYFEILKKVPEIFDELNIEQDIDFDFAVRVKDVLRNKIIFKQADAINQAKSALPDNSIVMARNFWPYLKNERTRIELAENLYSSLGENSAVVIGDFDNFQGVSCSKTLRDAGFHCRYDNYSIWEKTEMPEYINWLDLMANYNTPVRTEIYKDTIKQYRPNNPQLREENPG